MTPIIHIILLYTIFFIFEESSGLNSVSAPLVQHVLSTPGLRHIPILKQGDTLSVNLVVGVQSIDKIDSDKNQVEASLMVSQIWPSGVKWNPEDFNGISRQILYQSQMWTPDIIISNSVSSPINFSPPNVILLNDGFAVLNKHFKIVLDCNAREYTCIAKFQSASFANNFVVLNGPEYVPFDLGLFHDVWVNSGGRFQARNGAYRKTKLQVLKDGRRALDMVTYSFTIKDTRPHYRRRPSKMVLSWN